MLTELFFFKQLLKFHSIACACTFLTDELLNNGMKMSCTAAIIFATFGTGKWFSSNTHKRKEKK